MQIAASKQCRSRLIPDVALGIELHCNGQAVGDLPQKTQEGTKMKWGASKKVSDTNGTGIVLSCCSVTISVRIAGLLHEFVPFWSAFEFASFLTPRSLANG